MAKIDFDVPALIGRLQRSNLDAALVGHDSLVLRLFR
jgi:hypothetical protein